MEQRPSDSTLHCLSSFRGLGWRCFFLCRGLRRRWTDGYGVRFRFCPGRPRGRVHGLRRKPVGRQWRADRAPTFPTGEEEPLLSECVQELRAEEQPTPPGARACPLKMEGREVVLPSPACGRRVEDSVHIPEPPLSALSASPRIASHLPLYGYSLPGHHDSQVISSRFRLPRGGLRSALTSCTVSDPMAPCRLGL